MARPRTPLPDRETVRALIDANGCVSVRVTPGSRTEALEIADGRLSAKVRAVPENGKANTAVASLIAQALSIAPGRVELLRGATSREKQFRVS
jgi:uncharacterized protein